MGFRSGVDRGKTLGSEISRHRTGLRTDCDNDDGVPVFPSLLRSMRVCTFLFRITTTTHDETLVPHPIEVRGTDGRMRLDRLSPSVDS